MKEYIQKSDLPYIPPHRPHRYKWKKGILLVLLFVLLLSYVMIYHTHKQLPEGISIEGPVHYVEDINFLYDLTYMQGDEEIHEQVIFDRVNEAIEEAEQFIVIDMFLFNGYYDQGKSFPPLTQTLTNKLINQKQKNPNMTIILITDELNTGYGSFSSKELRILQENGIETELTDVDKLRDSSPIYSGIWRIFFQWFGQSGNGWINNPLANTAPEITLRSHMKLFNVKANHRKVIATEKRLIITSANSHDASAYNSNSAIEVTGDIIGDALVSEQGAIALSGSKRQVPEYKPNGREAGEISVRLLTEGKILKHVLKAIDDTEAGDTLWLGMFYLADRQVIRAMLEASERGAHLRLILDPNENAFGSDKIGLPNRPVASELLVKSEDRIQIRWYNTSREQYHTKLMFIETSDKVIVNTGSANFTTRNLDDLNLETNLAIEAPKESQFAQEVSAYFNRLWNNEGATYTLEYEKYQEDTIWIKKVIYALQSLLGFTTF